MWKDVNDLTETERRRKLVRLAAIASLAAIAYSLFFSLLAVNKILVTGLIGDVFNFADIADVILDGSLPYVDAKVEHLPIALIPIVGLQAIARLSGIPIWLLWPSAMAAIFITSALSVDRFSAERPAGFVYIAVSLPLLPLALFRIEPWIVLLAVMAIGAFLKNRTAIGVGLIVAGALGKGWPIVISILPWKRGKHAAAVVSVIVSLLALGIVATQEGFQSGREFDGIHTETLIGSTAVLWRHISGESLQIFSSAGARYVAVPNWAVLLNAIPGIITAGAAMMIARRKLSDRALVSLIGLAVLAIILLSPLFSTQFMVWLTPFVAGVSLISRRVYIAAALFGLASITFFHDDSLLWAMEIFAANVLVLVLAVIWSRELLNATGLADPSQDPSTSLKNLPV